MSSQFIISCVTCFNKSKVRIGYTINNKGLLRLAFPVSTSYTAKNLNELFKENYNCPFCNTTLVITPKTMRFASKFIHNKYHIDLMENSLIISNGSQLIKIDYDCNQKQIYELEQEKDGENIPTPSELREIFDMRDEVDLRQWKITIISKEITNPYYQKVKP